MEAADDDRQPAARNGRASRQRGKLRRLNTDEADQRLAAAPANIGDDAPAGYGGSFRRRP
jgi:hypothetical protein